MKIAIVGIGRVGSTLAYALTLKGVADELVLVNRTVETALGDAEDLTHAQSFVDRSMTIRAGSVADATGADIVVVCASAPMPSDPSSRLQLAPANAALYAQLIPEIARCCPDAVLVIVTNPVDVMTWHALKLSGFDPSRVLGTGTLIDSARFRSLLSQSIGIHTDDLRAYILGEHGDSQFPALSLAVTGGERIDRLPDASQLFDQAVQLGHRVMRHKGYTNFAIASATALIVDAIVNDSRRTIPVTTLIDGYLGVRDVCLTVPTVIGRCGVVRRLEPALNAEEAEAFLRCAQIVRESIASTTASIGRT